MHLVMLIAMPIDFLARNTPAVCQMIKNDYVTNPRVL